MDSRGQSLRFDRGFAIGDGARGEFDRPERQAAFFPFFSQAETKPAGGGAEVDREALRGRKRVHEIEQLKGFPSEVNVMSGRIGFRGPVAMQDETLRDSTQGRAFVLVFKSNDRASRIFGEPRSLEFGGRGAQAQTKVTQEGREAFRVLSKPEEVVRGEWLPLVLERGKLLKKP